MIIYKKLLFKTYYIIWKKNFEELLIYINEHVLHE